MLSIIGGLIAGIVGVWLIALRWWWEFVDVLKGTVPALLIFGGFIAIVAGISSIKDKMAAKKEEAQTPPPAAEEKKP